MFANMSEPEEAEEVPAVTGARKRSAVGRVLKKLSEFLFSQVGLCAMVVAYTILGGFVFRHLEKTNEVHECKERQEKYETLENSTIEKLVDISSGEREQSQEGLDVLIKSTVPTTRSSAARLTSTAGLAHESKTTGGRTSIPHIRGRKLDVSTGMPIGKTPSGHITTPRSTSGTTSAKLSNSLVSPSDKSKSSPGVIPEVTGSTQGESNQPTTTSINTAAKIKPTTASTTLGLSINKFRRSADKRAPDSIHYTSSSSVVPTPDDVTHPDDLMYDEEEPVVDSGVWLEYSKALREHNERLLQIGYDGIDCQKKEEFGDWSLAGSMLFSVTVFTTIGYGNIAPRTYWGRLTCICYAMLGIPLMMICLANLGSLLGNIFRFVYARVICCGCCVLSQNPTNSPARRSKPAPKIHNSSNNDFQIKKNNSTKDLDNNSMHGNEENNPFHTEEAEQASEAQERPSTEEERSIPQHTSMGMMRIRHGGKTKQSQVEIDQGRVTVPMCMSLGVIAAYLFVGSILFGVWEGWDPLMSAYYCFVTISTIGFGDVVPGSADFQSEGDAWKLGMAAMYMLFGMALLSMCINLLQDGMMEKCRMIGKKIGLSDE